MDRMAESDWAAVRRWVELSEHCICPGCMRMLMIRERPNRMCDDCRLKA
jgi:hypothetical protein